MLALKVIQNTKEVAGLLFIPAPESGSVNRKTR